MYEVSLVEALTPRAWIRPHDPLEEVDHSYFRLPPVSVSSTRSPFTCPADPWARSERPPSPPKHRSAFLPPALPSRVTNGHQDSHRYSTFTPAKHAVVLASPTLSRARYPPDKRNIYPGYPRPTPDQVNEVAEPPWRGARHRHQNSVKSITLPTMSIAEAELETSAAQRKVMSPKVESDYRQNRDYPVSPPPKQNSGRHIASKVPLYHEDIAHDLIAADDDYHQTSEPEPANCKVLTEPSAVSSKVGKLGKFKAAALGSENMSRALDGKAWWHDQGNAVGTQRIQVSWLIVAIMLVLVVVGGAVGGVLGSRHKTETSSSTSSPSGSAPGSSVDYNINSPQIKALMNNTKLYRVFPGMDYTPLDTQYPACLTKPPGQNNITLDVAILSQLTPAIRLYGTDCSQTEMVLTAIDRLKMNSSLTIWLGVWLGNNETTNARQLSQMYEILQTYPTSHFKGVIVGNEVLFQETLTLEELGIYLNNVRANLTRLGIDLPVATSDLGSDWTSELASYSDVVMANVHPFFAGVTAAEAASWTWDFWQDNDVVLTTSNQSSVDGAPRNIISEVGWPTQGGNDCGTNNTCTSSTVGSVAGIDELNTFMDAWVCQAMANGTEYFWFEAFDEPWKVVYDSEEDGWEDHWGLLDVDRNLKEGIKIPDCGGKDD